MSEDVKTNRRPRFSLLNLVSLMTIVAMGVALWRINGELTQLRTEVGGYRQQLGYLYIPESKTEKTYAMQVEPEEEDEWRYRIFLPEGRTYRLRIAHGVLPGRTAERWEWKDYLADVAQATSGSSRSWEPGEFVLSFRVKRQEDPADSRENWVFETRRVGEGSKASTTLTAPWMADRRTWSSWRSMVNRKQKAFDPDDPLPLLIVRRGAVTEGPRGGYTTTVADAREDSEGFMLWIEPIK